MIPHDKKLHFGAGLLIAISAGLCFGPAWGLAAAALAGLGKEIYDYIDYGGPDPWDIVATVAGGLVGYIIMEIIN